MQEVVEGPAPGTSLRQFVADDPGSNRQTLPIPLPFDCENMLELGENDTLDWGAVRVSGLVGGALEKGNMVASPESKWKSPPKEFDFYGLLGTPGESIKDEVSGGIPTSYYAPRGFLQVEKTVWAEPFPKVDHDRFSGLTVRNAEADVTLEKIDGMSGGPIIGCKWTENDDFDFWPIAIKSGCVYGRPNKPIVADFLEPLCERLRSL